jgi:hypothetical protein
MSMPLVAVLVAATTGIAATVAVLDGRVESGRVVPAVTASADSAEGWTRRGLRPVDAVQRPETIGTANAGPRRGMRGSPESSQALPLAGFGDWTRRGTRSVPPS